MNIIIVQFHNLKKKENKMIKKLMTLVVLAASMCNAADNLDDTERQRYTYATQYAQKSLDYKKKIEWRNSTAGQAYGFVCGLTLVGWPLIVMHDNKIDKKYNSYKKLGFNEIDGALKYSALVHGAEGGLSPIYLLNLDNLIIKSSGGNISDFSSLLKAVGYSVSDIKEAIKSFD